LRERVVAAVSAGKFCSEGAEQFAVSRSSAIKWSRRKPETGSAAPAKFGGYRPFLLAGHRDWIARRIAEKPDLTVQALLDELKAKGKVVSFDTLWRFLWGPWHDLQKKSFCQASKTDPTSSDGAFGGRSIKAGLILHDWFSLTKLGSRPPWQSSGAGAGAACHSKQSCRTGTGRH
jgi:transposase